VAVTAETDMYTINKNLVGYQAAKINITSASKIKPGLATKWG
jgi:hypothetical protein